MRSTLLPAAACSLAALLGVCAPSSGSAAPALVMDASTGAVFYEEEATQPWFPASLSKLMTVYVALKAVHEGRLTLDTPLVVSQYAASMSPSKMGFRPGTEVTLDNALKMLMVKSANDLAVTIAEGVSGSVDAFADEMNAAAASLGMAQSHFVNPNGLPDLRQVSSARDMALLGRALYLQFPQHADLFNIYAFRLGSRFSRNHNPLLAAYPGTEGMKTGFTCSAGFNIVAAARRGDRRLITVVLGAPSSGARTAMATALLDRGFASRTPVGSVSTLNGFASNEPPDMHGKACSGRARATRDYMASVERIKVVMSNGSWQMQAAAPEPGSLVQNGKKKSKAAVNAAADALPAGLAVVSVYVGRAPGWDGPVAQARPANMPVGTPAPVSAYAETKPTVLDGSAAPIAASTVDALSLRRNAKPAAKPGPKAVAARQNADNSDADTAPQVKPAKHAKAAHQRRLVQTADHRHGGRRKHLAAAKPLAEGDAAEKPLVSTHSGHSGRRPEGE